jgi:hypothetical protein
MSSDNYGHFRILGYAKALRQCGWAVEQLGYSEAPHAAPDRYDVIVWDGGVPEEFLARVTSRQRLILLGGAGDDLEHYRRHAEKIALATSTFYYWDDPGRGLLLADRSLWSAMPHRARWHWRLQRRYRRYGSPRFWRALGIPFMYLPIAADPDVFYPTGAKAAWKWVFCGTVKNRHFIRDLMAHSDASGWSYNVCAPDRGTHVRPEQLNDLYNRGAICPNECGHGVFFRELNVRTFELGMAGRAQISDMRWLAEPLLAPYARFYAGKRANAEDRRFGIGLFQDEGSPPPDEVHEFFRQRHSFLARLRAAGAVIGCDLTRGRAKPFEGPAIAPGSVLPCPSTAENGAIR